MKKTPTKWVHKYFPQSAPSIAERVLDALNVAHAADAAEGVVQRTLLALPMPPEEREQLEREAEALELSYNDLVKWLLIAGLIDAPGLPDDIRHQLEADWAVFTAAMDAKFERLDLLMAKAGVA